MKDWFSDDAFWIEFYPTMFNETKFEEGREHVEGVLSLVDLAVLHNIYRSLKPGGTVLIDTLSKERVASGFKPWSVQEWPDGTLLVGKPQILDNWTRVKYDYTLVKGEKALTYQVGYTIYSGCELEDLLCRVGFSDVVLYGDFDGSSFGLDSERLIAVAKKPA